MKVYLVSALIIIIGLFIIIAEEKKENEFTSYCEGWEEGYKQGWCDEIPNCITPIIPICPTPEINCNKGYKCGYNRAFKQGLIDREKKINGNN